jgi:hypothetical protein
MDVKAGTFELDAYEFVRDGESVYQHGGQCAEVCKTGASWVGPDGLTYSAPLTSVLAVRNKKPRKKSTPGRSNTRGQA